MPLHDAIVFVGKKKPFFGDECVVIEARYYDPEVGRFISEDPIGFAGGDLNLFVYVGNNPLLFIDPWGLCEQNSNALRDVLRGAEFGFRAAGVVMKETAKIVAVDVGLALTNYVPLHKVVGLPTSRVLSGGVIHHNFIGLEQTAYQTSSRIETIRNEVFTNE